MSVDFKHRMMGDEVEHFMDGASTDDDDRHVYLGGEDAPALKTVDGVVIAPGLRVKLREQEAGKAVALIASFLNPEQQAQAGQYASKLSQANVGVVKSIGADGKVLVTTSLGDVSLPANSLVSEAGALSMPGLIPGYKPPARTYSGLTAGEWTGVAIGGAGVLGLLAYFLTRKK